jgi:hypothetical protein
MHKEISPEEKLLSIIKGKQSVPEENAPKPEIKDIKPQPRASWSRIDDYIVTILKNDLLKNNVLDAQILKVFNKYTVIIAALVAVYLVLDIMLVSPSRQASKFIARTAASGVAAIVPAQATMPIETKSYSYYSNRMSGRSIFSSGPYIQTDLQGSGMEPSAELSGGNLGLVGIVPGASPQAIVEDKKNQKTYYLVKGQSINGISVEEINEDKVVLEYKGKSMTLFL